MVVEIVPIERSPVIAEGSQLPGEDLQSKGQPVGGGQRDVQPHFGELEAASRRVGEIIVRRSEEETLADERVHVERGKLSGQGQLDRCRGPLRKEDSGQRRDRQARRDSPSVLPPHCAAPGQVQAFRGTSFTPDCSFRRWTGLLQAFSEADYRNHALRWTGKFSMCPAHSAAAAYALRPICLKSRSHWRARGGYAHTSGAICNCSRFQTLALTDLN